MALQDARARDPAHPGRQALVVGGLVIRQSAILVVAGLAVGLVIVRLAEGALARVLYGVSPSDFGRSRPPACSCSWPRSSRALAPALRAMRVDPVEGLRAE